jgi:hypothetical protein
VVYWALGRNRRFGGICFLSLLVLSRRWKQNVPLKRSFSHTRQCHEPEYHNLNNHRHERLKMEVYILLHIQKCFVTVRFIISITQFRVTTW